MRQTIYNGLGATSNDLEANEANTLVKPSSAPLNW